MDIFWGRGSIQPITECIIYSLKDQIHKCLLEFLLAAVGFFFCPRPSRLTVSNIKLQFVLSPLTISSGQWPLLVKVLHSLLKC